MVFATFHNQMRNCFPNEGYVEEWGKWGTFYVEFIEIKESVGDDGMFEKMNRSVVLLPLSLDALERLSSTW